MTDLANHGIKKRFPNTLDQSGALAVILAVALIMLAGVAALAIDIGHLVWVQSELAKAAETGALAGASTLVPYIAGNPPQPDLSRFQTATTNIVTGKDTVTGTNYSYADGKPLTDCTVQSGYWSMVQRLFFPTAPAETSAPVPAIQVTVAKKSGQNNGPLQWFFATALGFSPTKDLSASSVATLSFPAGMPVSSVFPFAVSQAAVDQYWSQGSGEFNIGTGSSFGQWTSLLVNNSGASYVKSLLDYGNPTPLKKDDPIYIQSGVVASNYGDVQATKTGKTVVIPVVASVNSNLPEKILGFVAFYIKSSDQGTKIIMGHFDKTYVIKQATSFSLSGYSPTHHSLLVN